MDGKARKIGLGALILLLLGCGGGIIVQDNTRKCKRNCKTILISVWGNKGEKTAWVTLNVTSASGDWAGTFPKPRIIKIPAAAKLIYTQGDATTMTVTARPSYESGDESFHANRFVGCKFTNKDKTREYVTSISSPTKGAFCKYTFT